MAIATHPPRLEHARKGANPTLELIEYVRGALRLAGEPVSRNILLETLAQWGHSTNRPTLNAVLGFLADEGCIVEGSKGILWVPHASEGLVRSIRAGRPL
ncbi:MAG: hypothetical protein KGJ23_08880 [Euryarchaeota archaeon]|nr:hypothetical protein [Euryarchaeota archaeon]MDE1836718.1 hypothetical protein [Euryarchaeota archaeon]MDE1881747.1 hypothetical protein [Euryarchaeota archaeon]MDE2044702.1 hypothetical protein [Thermoplasmata archaeon]